jgi:hypothetical protein
MPELPSEVEGFKYDTFYGRGGRAVDPLLGVKGTPDGSRKAPKQTQWSPMEPVGSQNLFTGGRVSPASERQWRTHANLSHKTQHCEFA